MADSITLNNSDLLKGLMPVNPHALVPVETLTNSPTSSTGSASVLEWNSNSDSELFQMSSPTSAPALSSPPLTPSGSRCISSVSLSPRSARSEVAPAINDHDDDDRWPNLGYESTPQALPAPVSVVSTCPSTVADEMPALNEHPEELDVLIERMFLTDLNNTVNKWKAQASNAGPASEVAAECSSRQPAMSPITTENTSMTSTVLPYTHYNSKGERISSPMTTVTPPTSVPTFSAADMESFFVTSSGQQQSAEQSLISIAEYFKQKASERTAMSTDSGNDQIDNTAAAAAAVSSKRPVSVSSALSYFSTPASTPHCDLPLSAEEASSPHSNPPHNLLAPMMMSLDDHKSPMSPSETGTVEHGCDLFASPPSSSRASTRSAEPKAPMLTTPDIWYSSGNVHDFLVAQNSLNTNASPNDTTLGARRHHGYFSDIPSWLPKPPQVGVRNTHNTYVGQSETTRLAPTLDIANGSKQNMDLPSIRTWLSQQFDPQPAPVPPTTSAPLSGGSAPRKPRPPLPAVPVSKPYAAPTPQLTLAQGELQMDNMPTPYAHALPSQWTGRISPPPPSLPPSSPALTAQPSGDDRSYTSNSMQGYGWSERREPFIPPEMSSTNGSTPTPPPSDHGPVPWACHYPNMPPPIPPQFHSLGQHYTPPFYNTAGCIPAPFPPPSLANEYDMRTPHTERKLRFASPSTPNIPPPSWYTNPYVNAPPPGLPPSVNPFVPTQYATRSPAMFKIPLHQSQQHQGYVYSSPAPVIPPPGSGSNNGWYTTSRKYAFVDASVIFRVEMTLFRVHRHFFERHSEHFRKLLSTYWFDGSDHVFLPDVNKVEFERLLSIFYPDDLTKSDIITLKGWTSVLSLSQKWDMAQIRALAIKNIGDHAWPMDKIIIAHKFNLHNPGPPWLFPAYKAICGRETPLTLQEAEQLDMPTVIKIWEVQHEVRAQGSMLRGAQAVDEKLGELVKEKFGTFEPEVMCAPVMMW